MHDPVILPSARRHGIADDDILHAYRHPIVRLDDPEIFVGGDRSGRLLEIGVSVSDGGDDTIIHAMPVRSKFLR